METTKEKAERLRAQLAEIRKELNPLEDQLKKQGLARIEEIRTQVRELVAEAEGLSREAGIIFYRETFLQGIDQEGLSHYGEQYYWQNSDYC
jgi:hypothetical protein